jgi:hypothetical protein
MVEGMVPFHTTFRPEEFLPSAVLRRFSAEVMLTSV